MTFARALASAVWERRVQLELTQVALERRCGVPQRRISEIENAAGNPTLRTLEHVASGLRLRLADLMAAAARVAAKAEQRHPEEA